MILQIPKDTVPYIRETLMAVASEGKRVMGDYPGMASVALQEKETGKNMHHLSFVLMKDDEGFYYESVGLIEVDGKRDVLKFRP